MGLQVQIDAVSEEVQKEVSKFSSKTLVFEMQDLEEMLSSVIQKFGLKQVFHNMTGIYEKKLSYETASEFVRKQIKEEGTARLYTNGRTSMAIHSYNVTVKQSIISKQRFTDPLIHVVSHDANEAMAINQSIRLILLKSLIRQYVDDNTKDGRGKISADIDELFFVRKGTNHIYDNFNSIIDSELSLIESQLFNWVVKHENTKKD